MGRQVALVPLLDQKTSKSKIFTAMSTDLNTPLFEISDGDDIEYEDDPAVTQAKCSNYRVEIGAVGIKKLGGFG